MVEPTTDLLPTNDKFSSTISDEERRLILAGPTPLVMKALAESVKALDTDTQNDVLRSAVALGTSGSHLSEGVKTFLDGVHGKELPLTAFLNLRPSDYLSIICGTIKGIAYSERDEINKLTQNLKVNGQKWLRGNPQKNEGLKAVDTIISRLDRITPQDQD